MELKLHPRFYLITIVFLIVGIVFGSNLLLKKRVEINIVDSNNDKVLAAADSKSSGDLIGGDIGGDIGGPLGSPQDNTQKSSGVAQGGAGIEDYVPVTISHTVKEGDTLQSIAEKYHADAQTIADFPNNGLKNSLQLQVGQILIIPNGYVDDQMAPPPPPIAHGTGQFSWPAIGTITQYAYSWHSGSIDIAIPLLTPVHAADDGKVVTVEHLTTGYGVHVIIDHGDGLTSLYGHLTQTNMVVGQGIRKGDVLGLSGSTGHSTGPHLHFEVRRGSAPVDPMTLLPSQ